MKLHKDYLEEFIHDPIAEIRGEEHRWYFEMESVFMHGDKHYAFKWVDDKGDDGYLWPWLDGALHDAEGMVKCYEVEPYEVTSVQWRRVK